MTVRTTEMYARLPEYLRRADAERGSPLRNLLAAAETQAELLYRDILRLRDDFFVETCEPWVLPYLADLVGLDLIETDAAANRRDLARTIAYRRRKGTPVQLETLAADVTGYSCRVVEFFESLVWRQNPWHLRLGCRETVDLRDRAALARLDTPFDTLAHLADLRPAAQRSGWRQVTKVGFFLWRLAAIPLFGIEARAVAAHAGAYHFDALGLPAPLFQSPAPPEQPTGEDWSRRAEGDVVGPLSPSFFRETQGRFRENPSASPTSWGATPAGFTIFVDDVPVDPRRLVAADLCQWREPDPDDVAVDPRLGRFRFGQNVRPAAAAVVTSRYHAGRAGALGGGGYDRPLARWDAPGPDDADPIARATVDRSAGATIADALDTLARSDRPLRVVEFQDSRNYAESIELPASFETLVLQAGPRQRPTLLVDAAHPLFSAPTGGVQGKRLVLRGLQFTGGGVSLRIPAGIDRIEFDDCTIDPGGGLAADGVALRPAGLTIEIAGSGVGVTLELRRSITGPLRLPKLLDGVSIVDSIVDGQAAGGIALADGPSVELVRTTVFGDLTCERLECSESLVTGRALVTFRQEGCVRFSYFGAGSQIPRAYRNAPSEPPPAFTSTRFGHPAYAQLALDCPSALARGGEDERELGVWNDRQTGRRLDHLRLRLAEYLPAGLTPVFVFVT